MRQRWLFVLALCALTFAGATGVMAQNTTQFICEEAANVTQNALIITGSINNIFDETRNLTGNVYCRMIVQDRNVITSLAEIGNQEAIERDVIHAVDLVGMFPEGETWRQFRTPVRVCLRGEGDVLFLGADDLSRTLTRLTAVSQPSSPNAEATESPEATATSVGTVIDGYSCADVPRAGIVMLTPPGGPLPSEGAAGASLANITVPPADPATVVELSNCQVVTKVNGLYLRREPSQTARIRWQFEDGQILTATGIAGNWYRIDFRGSPGWISALHVTPMGDCLATDGSPVGQDDPFAPADPAAVIELTNCEVITTFNGLHLRREPSLLARIRWTFEDGQGLRATGVAGNWYRIDFRGSPGWINAEYLELSGDCRP